MTCSFKKEERLCSRKAFETLIKDGSTLFHFPFRITWIKTEYPLSFPAQVAFAVPKKRYKRANKRNLIKRRLREAYRLNKQPFYDFLFQKNIRVQCLFVYIAPDILTYHEIESKIKNALNQIMASVNKTT